MGVSNDRLKGVVIFFTLSAAIFFISGWSYIKARREYRGCVVWSPNVDCSHAVFIATTIGIKFWVGILLLQWYM
jgi:hypothetical protein